MFGVRRSSGYMTSLHQSLLSIKVDRSANIAEWLLKLQNVILLGPKTTSHSWWQANTGTHRHFTFAPCCHSNETHAPITNLPNSAQLGGTPYHSPKWHPGLCSSVEMWQGTHTHTHTHTLTHRQMHMTNIHFTSSTTHAKCKYLRDVNDYRWWRTSQLHTAAQWMQRHRTAIPALVACLHQWSWSTSSPVSTDMGDHSQIYHLGVKPTTQITSASYPQWEGKWLLAMRQCSAARKETVGQASHCLCIMDAVVYPPTVSMASEREICTPPTLLVL